MKHEPDLESRLAAMPGADFAPSYRGDLERALHEAARPQAFFFRRVTIWQSALAAAVVGAASAAAVYFSMSPRPAAQQVTQQMDVVVVSIRMESVWRTEPALDISNWSPR